MGFASSLLPAGVVVAAWASANALRGPGSFDPNSFDPPPSFDPTGSFNDPTPAGTPVPTGTTMSPPWGSGGDGPPGLPALPGIATPMPTVKPVHTGPNHDGCPASCDDAADCRDYNQEASGMIDMFKRYSSTHPFAGVTDCTSPGISAACADATFGPAVRLVCAQACGSCPATPCSDDDVAAKVIMNHGLLTGSLYAYDGCQDTNGTLIMGHSRTLRHSESPGVRLACPLWCGCALQVGATNDPHVTNLAGEHFDINAPADHVLLRVPADEARPPLLELRGLVRADEDPQRACAVYVKMVTMSGELLDNATVQVRPLQRDAPGSNGAGTRNVAPFSLRRSVRSQEEGAWRSPGDFGATGGEPAIEPLSKSASITARLEDKQFGGTPEGQSFELAVGVGGARARIVVAQAQHQALNVEVFNLQTLGQKRLGGLLGSEPHSQDVEQPTEECMAFKASQPGSLGAEDARVREAVASRLAASWW